MRLGVGRATEAGLPLNGSPLAEKSRLLKDTERRKEQRNWFAVERSSVRLGESVIRSRARICSSFLVKSFIKRVERREEQRGPLRILKSHEKLFNPLSRAHHYP